MKKGLIGIALTIGIVVGTPVVALAHVVVTPAEANVGERTTFSISVPNERDVDVTSIKLDVPTGVTDAMPNVMGGWEITTEKSGDEVSSITWTGIIPAGQRADLIFKAQVPAKAGDVTWKAYQTYSDGQVVSWDQAPAANGEESESETTGPYSVTTVKDDITDTTAQTDAPSDNSSTATFALVFSVIALAFGIYGLFARRRAV